MKSILKNTANKLEFANLKNSLKTDEFLIGVCDEDFIATIGEQKDEYINFSNELKQSFFRDIWLEKNSTVYFVFRGNKNRILYSKTDLTYIIANIWYACLSEYLPLDRFGTKIRTLNNLCVADFVSDTSQEDVFTIGYINLGSEFSQPEKLFANRDKKTCCGIDKCEFNTIFQTVSINIIRMLGGE